MWETESYKSHEDHMQLYKALEKSMNHDHSQELTQDLAEARKKKKKSRESPKTPPGSPPHQAPTSPQPAGPSGASGALGASGSSQVPPPPPPPLSINQETQSSDDEDIGSAHIPKVNLRQDWWKPLEEERPATPEPAWSISSSDMPIPTNNWASALASNHSPPLEDLLLAPTDDIAIYGSKGSRLALSISKMKAAYYPDVGLEQMVPDYAVRTHMRILSVVRIEVFSMYGYDYMKKIVLRHLNHLPPKDKKILTTAVNQWTRHLVIRQQVEDFQLGIESYQTQLNLTKPQWDATGFKYKHDYTVLDSPRAIMFRDRYGVQMMMRFNEIHKFSDGTLQQIDEALDYRVKEFRFNMMNPGLNTRFWTRKDVDRSKAFMLAIQKRLKTKRIFHNLESFVGGRVRDGDYRLLKRTE
nr:hypothetical protein [Tanacetum cinerariifolium]